MRKTLFFFIAAFAVALLTVSCDDNKHIISSGEMEEILYDYHLADAMAQQAKGGYAQNAVAYRAAVLKKYDVSQSDFDSPMVYYMRHTDQLHTMYQHISDRMQEKLTRWVRARQVASRLRATLPMYGMEISRLFLSPMSRSTSIPSTLRRIRPSIRETSCYSASNQISSSRMACAMVSWCSLRH